METSQVGAEDLEQEFSKSTILTVVYFWHEQCPWCQRFAPVVNEVAREYKSKIRFARLNILANPLNQEIAHNNWRHEHAYVVVVQGKTCRPSRGASIQRRRGTRLE